MAGKSKIKSSNPFTDVRMVSSYDGSGNERKNHRVIEILQDVENRNGFEAEPEWIDIATVGNDYQLIPNEVVKNVADDIMSRCDTEFEAITVSRDKEQRVKQLWNGKSFQMFYRSSEPVAVMNGNRNHELFIGLMFKNSYDLSFSFSIEVFAINGYCTNEYYSRNRFGYFSIRHTPGSFDRESFEFADALNNISAGVQNVVKVVPRLEELTAKPLTVDDICRTKKGLKFPKTSWVDVLDQLDLEEKNHFGLYQALTNVAIHKITGASALTAGNAIGEYFLNGNKTDNMIHHSGNHTVVNDVDNLAHA